MNQDARIFIAGSRGLVGSAIVRRLENAGATVLDEPCVVDGNLITARFPYDLPRLIRAMVGQLAAGR